MPCWRVLLQCFDTSAQRAWKVARRACSNKPTADLLQQRDRGRVARALPRGGGQLHLDDLHAGREGVVDLRRSRVVASETELQNVRAEMVLL